MFLAGAGDPLPAEVLKLLVHKIKPNEEDSSEEFGKEEFHELQKINKYIPLTGKTFQRISNNRIVRHAINMLSQHVGIFDEEACKRVLKTIQEERKAQNQIDVIISGG